jgi:hypothetical protein
MTPRADEDARIEAFFETRQPDLPDRTLQTVRREIRQISQLRAIRQPGVGDILVARFVAAAAVLVALSIAFINVLPVLGPGGVPTPAQLATTVPSPSALPSAAAPPSDPTVFTSQLYGYTITIPAGWVSAPAIVRWDGRRQPGPDAETDKFGGPGQLSAFGFAGPFSGNLAALVSDRKAATARDHADTCPVPEPEATEPLQIGGQRWVLLGWDCGALINTAVTVRDGVAYVFTYRDLGIRAATDAADRAIFRSMLDSIELPT